MNHTKQRGAPPCYRVRYGDTPVMVQNCAYAHSINARVVRNCALARERVNFLGSTSITILWIIWILLVRLSMEVCLCPSASVFGGAGS